MLRKKRNTAQEESAETAAKAAEKPDSETPPTGPDESSGEVPRNRGARLGEILVEENVITREQLDEALGEQRKSGGFLGKKLMELEFIDQQTLTLFLVKQCKIPHLNLLDYQLDAEVVRLISPDLCRKYSILPIDKMGKILTLAMVDPLNVEALSAVRQAFPELRIKPILCDWDHFDTVFRQTFQDASQDAQASEAPDAYSEFDLPPQARKSKPGQEKSDVPKDEGAPTEDPSGAGVADDVPLATQLEESDAPLQDVLSELAVTLRHLDTQLGPLAIAMNRVIDAGDVFTKARQLETAQVSEENWRDLNGNESPPPTKHLLTAHEPTQFASSEDGNGGKKSSAGGAKPTFSFERFIPGKVNETTYLLAQAIAENPGSEHNPFFVAGGVGLGKTHLISAIGNAVAANHGDFCVGYTSASRFASHVLEARANGLMQEFLASYGHQSVLIVDDVQFLGGRIEAQEEFFHVFNTLYEQGRQIIIAGDKLPEKLGLLEKRLISRFEGGMVALLKPPEWEARIQILKQHAEGSDTKVPQEVLAMVALHVPEDVRMLIGALRKIIGFAQLKGEAITCELASNVLSGKDAGEAA